jgi:hypothetical protein
MTTDAWSTFGGIGKSVDQSHTSMTLTDTWKVKWSGVKAEASSGCGWEISGRLRVSRTWSSFGGVGIGLASFNRQAEPIGLAAQFDYAFHGYRPVSYPTDHTLELVYPSDDTLEAAPAKLDHAWHAFNVVVDSAGHIVAVVDGRKVLEAQGSRVCGYPIIRVWNGVSEITSLEVKRHR